MLQQLICLILWHLRIWTRKAIRLDFIAFLHFIFVCVCVVLGLNPGLIHAKYVLCLELHHAKYVLCLELALHFILQWKMSFIIAWKVCLPCLVSCQKEQKRRTDLQKYTCEPGVVMHVHNPSTGEGEAKRLPQVEGQPEIPSEIFSKTKWKPKNIYAGYDGTCL